MTVIERRRCSHAAPLAAHWPAPACAGLAVRPQRCCPRAAPLACGTSLARARGQFARLECGAGSARHAGELPLGAPRQSNKARRARVTTTQRYGATGGELPLGAPPHPQRHALARWHACQPQQPRLLSQPRGESALSLGAHARATHGPRSQRPQRARVLARTYASTQAGAEARAHSRPVYARTLRVACACT